MGRGVDVPGQVAVVGFDDTPIASAHRPSLTSIQQDASAAGRALGRAILAILDGGQPPVVSPLPVTLIARESSA
jgi:DNA-binding LacI/PurR family transcriptional regulator